MSPEMSGATQAFIRISYAILLLGTLLRLLPHGRRFFRSRRWGGYAQPSASVDALQNPFVYPLLMALWLSCAALLALGTWSVAAALVNLLLCRYFFVSMRWRGLSRGMGAPGFMTYWLAAAVFLLEYTWRFAPAIRGLALLVIQVDFAFIMLSSGFYKYMAGFTRNRGLELGLANPAWGYWWKFYARFDTNRWWFKVLNHLAWLTEVVAGVLMLIPLPACRFIGGALIAASFFFVGTQIRLGFLAWMVVLCGVFFIAPGNPVDQWLMLFVPASPLPTTKAMGGLPWLNAALSSALWLYLLLLPLAHAGLSWNFYLRKTLPQPFQRALEAYTNFFGIIVWRVFTINLVNFFVNVWQRPRDGERPRTLVSRYGWGGNPRYNHVAESITITCVFTTLKYYASKPELFRERLLAYAGTVPCPEDCVLVFEYLAIRQGPGGCEFVPVVEYTVDGKARTIDQTVLSEEVSVSADHPFSPIHEGTRPGSYAPTHAR